MNKSVYYTPCLKTYEMGASDVLCDSFKGQNVQDYDVESYELDD